MENISQTDIQKIKKYMELKREIIENDKVIRSYKVVQSELEKKIVDFLLKNDTEELIINGSSKLILDKKTKRESINKKYIEQRCLEYSNGDLTKAGNLVNFLYDKSARTTEKKMKLKNERNKKEKGKKKK